ncbi:uncharacterized protein V1477_019653 [Vespula maculifrons]|uniref:Uncharacterized protein n=1 Tax=Vespula maculifrons TaxID=7453 RepID=A0ABD2AR10_VESMC
MALKKEEAARKKKLIGISFLWYADEYTSQYSQTHAPQNETEWWGYCAIWGKYKAAALGSGSSHATNFHHSNLNPRVTHAPQNETEWWGYCATWGKYKAAAFGSGSSYATNFHHSNLNPRGTHAPQNETEWWGYCATWGKYKAGALGSGSSHATNFHHSNLNPRGTHAPQNETEWWGYCATWGKYKAGALGSGSNFHCALSEDFDSLPPREDLEISQEAIRACINEQLIQIYNSLFDFRPTCETYMRSGDSRLRMTTTISVLWPTFIVPGSVVRWTSSSELRNFAGSHSCKY